MLNILDDTANPVEPFLRSDRMPHIWCPGCGIGTTVNSFSRALIDSKIDLESLALVSGIGWFGFVAGPALIGQLAAISSLRVALIILPVLTALITDRKSVV